MAKFNKDLDENNEIQSTNQLISRVNSFIIDLNRETDQIHHNITFFGVERNEHMGYKMVSGDINGDNFSDLIVSCVPGETNSPNKNRLGCGKVYVIFGHPYINPINDLGKKADLIIYGTEAQDYLGSELTIGDINNDGIEDIIIGAQYADGSGNLKNACGEVYIIYGNESFPSIWDLSKTPANVTIYGPDANDYIGDSLSTGDINNDSFDDIIIGIRSGKGPNNKRTDQIYECGEVRIIYGNTTFSTTIDLDISSDIIIYGKDPRDQIGDAVAIDDINSDGYNDILIGATWAAGIDNKKYWGGEVYVIFNNGSLPSLWDLNTTSANITIYATDSGDSFGSKIVTGDINNDNFKDIIISAPQADGSSNNRNNCGEVYIFKGTNISLPTILNASDANTIIFGEENTDEIGNAIALEDINNDKYDDLIVSAQTADGPSNTRKNCGDVYLFNGSSTLSSIIDLSNQNPNVTIYGAECVPTITGLQGDEAGTSVLITDINGDQFNEIFLSAPNADGRANESEDCGELYVILFNNNCQPVPIIDFVRLENGAGIDNKTCFANYSTPYNFKVKVSTPNNIADLKIVTLSLGYRWSVHVQRYNWSKNTGKFSEAWDPNNLGIISNLSTYSTDNKHYWIIDFYIKFNWTIDNFYHSIQVHTVSNSDFEDWLNLTSDLYRVENRLDLIGTLIVNSEYHGKLIENDWVRGDEEITWDGLKIAYKDNPSIFPSNDQNLSVMIEDTSGKSWTKKVLVNQKIKIITSTNNSSKKDENYTFSIIGIPSKSDSSNVFFNLNIDADPVRFSNYFPKSNAWLASVKPFFGIYIYDPSTQVNLLSIQYRISLDNGSTWTNWKNDNLKQKQYLNGMNCTASYLLQDGQNNLIQWRANDIIGNNLNFSKIYRICIDVSNVSFTNPKPSSDITNINQVVQCSITIKDSLSGVNASSIEFSTSTTGIWGYGDWQSANRVNNDNIINCTVTPTFVEGTDNYIRWRAKDVVGNGYHVSDNYQIKIKLNKPPSTTLISPKNRSIIYTLSPELVWNTDDPDNDTTLSHSIYLSTDKEKIINLNKTAILKSNIVNQFFELDTQLKDNTTYYWTIIPFDGKTIGYCTSDFWEFRIQTTAEIPTSTLIEPFNNTNITSTTPKLSWVLNYFNSSIVTYNIYLAKSPVVVELISDKYLYQEEYKLTTFIVEKPLIRGETYYWTVIPIADHPSGKLEGICRSGQWNFKIELPVDYNYNFSMGIESINLTVEQGGIITTNITITNLGDITDTIFLEISKGTLNANIAFEDSINKINLLKDEQKKITLEIIVSPITTPKNYTIQITAESEKAKLDGKDVSVTKSIRLKVLEKVPEDQIKDDSEKQYGFWDMALMLFIVLIIFILIVISIFVYKARKESRIPTVKAELMYKPPPHLALPEGEAKGEEDMLLPGADEEIVPTLGAPGVSTRYQLPKAVLTKKQELKLLREKFLLGEIDKETYKEMKNEIENTEDITAEDQDLDLKGKLPGQTEDFGLEDIEDIEDIEQDGLSSEIEDLETMEQEELEKTTEIPVEESVIDSELQDIPEEIYPFPDDGFCITCGQSLDPDMAYCWSCETKYETLEE